MPVTPTYPGVYIEEISSGVRTIVGVATSVAAFIDSFRKGPIDTPVRLFSMGDFEREFGGLDSGSEASYAIQQFFLNGGQECWVVRVGSGAAAASAEIDNVIPAAASALRIEAIHPGVWGNNLSVRIDSVEPGAASFDLAVTETATSGGRTVVVQQELFRALTMTNAETVVNDETTGSKLIRIDTTGTDAPLANGTFSGRFTAATVTIPASPSLGIIITDGTTTQTATLSLVFPTGTNLASVPLRLVAQVVENAIRAAQPANPVFANATVTLIEQSGVFRLLLLTGGGSPYNRMVFDDGASTTATALQLVGGAAVTAPSINSQAYQLGAPAEGGFLTDTAQLNGVNGDDGSLSVATSANIATAIIGNEVGKTGIRALDDVDMFNLLCIPRTSNVGTGNGLLERLAAQAVMSVAVQYCGQRRAFFIMDTPAGVDEPAEIRTWLTDNATLRDRNAALFFPRVRIPDPLNEFRLRSVGASGTIAGLFARTDRDRGVWKAPAGTEASLTNVAAYDYTLTDAENGSLNPLAINCLRNFPIYGPICWGSRTLDGSDVAASEWKYIPVRRLALYLEESLFRGSQWVVFEPNDEPLWSQIRLNVGAFMQNLFRQGAFQGKTPREAYLVKCDRETTTQNDINLGIVNIVVGFAPLKPAEFVILKIQQLAGQIDV
jgi:uncharacterized protein